MPDVLDTPCTRPVSLRWDDVLPYRVEWRPDLVTRWTYLRSTDDPHEGNEIMEAALKRWGGQVRVLEVTALGANGVGTGESHG